MINDERVSRNDTCSSFDSYHLSGDSEYQNDEESSLGSYSDVNDDGDLEVSPVSREQGEDPQLGIETTLSDQVEEYKSKLGEQMAIEDLQRLVGITSAEENAVSKSDMPPYEIRWENQEDKLSSLTWINLSHNGIYIII